MKLLKYILGIMMLSMVVGCGSVVNQIPDSNDDRVEIQIEDVNTNDDTLEDTNENSDTNVSSDTNQNSDTTQNSGGITSDEAKQIALDHAGYLSSEVTFMKVEKGIDDGVEEYEIEFYVGNKEYDYEINAATGSILSVDYDMETQIANNTTSSDYISEASAKQIALDHAGVLESDTKALTIKLDLDDGVAEYEVEFYVGKVEYDYEINATTGSVIDFSKDYD